MNNEALYKKMAEDAVKKAMAMRDEFVSTISHELRTPLSISKEGLSLVLRGKVGEITPRQREILQMAESNIDRLAFLIDDILDVSKIESGTMTLRREPVDAVEALRENCRGWEPRVKSKNIELSLSAPGNPVILSIDQMRFSQILSNLISNAFKFTPDGGKIAVHVEESNARVKFVVSDTGPGISKEELPKIFEKFYQGKRTYGPGTQGTGLGLNIVKSLVELHGGELTVESEAGKGSVFSFTIPKSADVKEGNIANG